MVVKFVLLGALCAISLAKDDSKWVWGDNNRGETSGRLNFEREPRYEIYEGNDRPYRPSHSEAYYERPPYRPELNHINRPGGVYGGGNGIYGNGGGGGGIHGSGIHGGGIYGGGDGVYGNGHQHNSGNYGHGHHHYTDVDDAHHTDVLAGPVPSWVREGPYKDYDKCKCTEKFNCKTPGISYGHCDAGKQYCCYATKNPLGGPPPSRPHHSLENGILSGPGGPVDGLRPGHHGAYRPGGGFGIGGGGRGEYGPGPISNRPIHSPENGILVGPGGPFDRPLGGRPGGGYGGFGLGRSSKN